MYPCTGCGTLHESRGRCASCTTNRPRTQRSDAEKARRRAKWQEQVWRDPRHRAWRKRILRRDEGICQLCGQPGNIADHHPPLIELALHGLDPFADEHGRCLCLACSGKTDGARAHTR